MLRINLFVFILTAIAYLIGIYFFPFMLTSRDVLHQVWVISGVVTWILMTEAIVIAARPSWIERVSGEPLGKLMQAHKTLGWWMVGFAFIHFLAPFVRDIITAFYPVVEVPMMEEHAIHGFRSGVWVYSHPIAGLTGILVSLYMLSVIWRDIKHAKKKISWPKWEKAHLMWAWMYIFLAFHALRTLKETELMMPLGWVTTIAAILGIWASVNIIRGRKGSAMRYDGALDSIKADGGVLQLEVKTELADTIGPGRFVYLSRPGDKEDSHPFAVAGADKKTGLLTFWIKEAGEWTKNLASMKAGDTIYVEGPWGAFFPKFIPGKTAAWVAGGAGIAPFLGWMEELKRDKAAGKPVPSITLWWSVKNRSEGGFERVETLCRELGIDLRVHETGENHDHLEPETVLAEHPATLAVCGRPGLTKAFKAAWKGAPENLTSEVY